MLREADDGDKILNCDKMNILPFKKNLTDLVRGLRNNKNNEQAYISQCIQEIKQELRADDKKDKMIAIQKLTYVR